MILFQVIDRIEGFAMVWLCCNRSHQGVSRVGRERVAITEVGGACTPRDGSAAPTEFSCQHKIHVLLQQCGLRRKGSTYLGVERSWALSEQFLRAQLGGEVVTGFHLQSWGAQQSCHASRGHVGTQDLLGS